MQVLVLIALVQYLVDRWLFDILLDVVGPNISTVQELAVGLFCQTSEQCDNHRQWRARC